jgi:hypothetical protein
MPDKVIIEGIPPHDGEYEIDLAEMTNEEWFLIKRLSGLRPAELDEALDTADAAVFVGLGAVVIQREGRRVTDNVVNQLMTARFGQIKVKWGGADPPAMSQKTPESSTDSSDRPSAHTGSSGSDGKDDSETSEADDPSATGQPVSVPSATSDRESLAA